MFIEECCRWSSGDGIQRAPARCGEFAGVGRGAVIAVPPECCEGAVLNMPAKASGCQVSATSTSSTTFAHHRGFSRTAFLAGTTVKRKCRCRRAAAAGLGGDRRGDAAVPSRSAHSRGRWLRCQGRRFRAVGLLAESRQGVKFTEQGNDRSALTDAGDQGIRDPASIAGKLRTFRLRASASRWAGQNSSKRVSGGPRCRRRWRSRVALCLNHLVHKLKMASVPPLPGKVKRDARQGFDHSAITLSSKSDPVVVTGPEFSAKNHV